jgi:hypothetical protein
MLRCQVDSVSASWIRGRGGWGGGRGGWGAGGGEGGEEVDREDESRGARGVERQRFRGEAHTHTGHW